MITKKTTLAAVSLTIAATNWFAPRSFADAISPSINGDGKDYSKEAPDTSYYGTGVAGRLSEASVLRFETEQELAAGHYEPALKKIAKAVQLDPADPTGHLMYARALSMKIRASKDPEPKVVLTALEEWKLIWHHDADLLEQMEGHREARKLSRLVKQMAKEGKFDPKDEQLASTKKQNQPDKEQLASDKDFDMH